MIISKIKRIWSVVTQDNVVLQWIIGILLVIDFIGWLNAVHALLTGR